MKKTLLSLFALVMGTVAYAQSELKVTFPMNEQEEIASYSCEWTGIDADGGTWTFKNFNNNKNAWQLIKCGWKTAATTSEITSPVIAEAVTEYAIEIGQTSCVTSCKLEVISGETVVESKDVTLTAGTVTVPLTGTENATYHLVIQNEKTSANGTTTISSLTITKAASANFATKPSLTEGGIFTTTPYDVTITNRESGATVYYTVDGTDPTTSSDSFTGEEKTIQINGTTTVKAMAVVSGKANSSVASATYTYEESIANTLETAYTTDEAIALIDLGSAQLSSTQVYVKGKVSKVQSFSPSYGSITYWLDDDAFEVYGGLNNNGEQFASIDDIKVGAEVVVYGIIKKYSTIYEMDKNNWLVQYTAPSKPEPTLTANYQTTLVIGDEDEFVVEYNGDGDVECTSSNENVAELIWDGATLSVDAVGVGTSTITISAPETENYQAKSLSYTLTVTEKLAPAAIPFTFDGGKADATPGKGMIATGLGNDYKASPKLKFDGTDDNLVIWIAESAKYLHYTIKGNGSDSIPGAYGQYDVMESVDGENYTSLKSYDHVEKDTTFETNIALNPDTRFVKFIYTTKTSGNVALGAIKINNDAVGVHGDVNGDGVVDIADVNAILTIMFSETAYAKEADVNEDDVVDIADVNAVLSIMFAN